MSNVNMAQVGMQQYAVSGAVSPLPKQQTGPAFSCMTNALQATMSGSTATTKKHVRGLRRSTMIPTTDALATFPAACTPATFQQGCVVQHAHCLVVFLVTYPRPACSSGKGPKAIAQLSGKLMRRALPGGPSIRTARTRQPPGTGHGCA